LHSWCCIISLVLMCAFYFILRVGIVWSLNLIQIWYEIQNDLRIGKRVENWKEFSILIWHWAETQSNPSSAQQAIPPSSPTLAHWPSPLLPCPMPPRRYHRCSPSIVPPWPRGHFMPEPPCALKTWKQSKPSWTPPRAVELEPQTELVLSLSESKPNRLKKSPIHTSNHSPI
jgi:hypothetical protein